jgi:hypothetical protein
MNRLGVLMVLMLICQNLKAELPSFPTLGFTQAKTEWTNGKPSTLWLRWLDAKNNILCYHFSLGQELGILPTDWKDIEVIILDVASHNLVDNGLTDVQKKDCFTTKVPNSWLDKMANVPPAPVPTPVPPTPVPSWKVALNGTTPDRPMKDINFVDLKVRAKVGDPCEPEIIKTITTKQSWHFTKSTTGVRGLAVCEIK